MRKKIFFVLSIFILSFSFLISEDFSALPLGYRSLQLGMSIDEVKKALQADALFDFRGDRDVSLLPNQEQQVIESQGLSFIHKAWFHFVEGALYSISLQMDTTKLDYGSIFKMLSEKYGKPSFLSPEQTSWEDEMVIMSLERPLTMKYLDKKTYASLLEEKRVEDAAFEISRDLFLESF